MCRCGQPAGSSSCPSSRRHQQLRLHQPPRVLSSSSTSSSACLVNQQRRPPPPPLLPTPSSSCSHPPRPAPQLCSTPAALALASSGAQWRWPSKCLHGADFLPAGSSRTPPAPFSTSSWGWQSLAYAFTTTPLHTRPPRCSPCFQREHAAPNPPPPPPTSRHMMADQHGRLVAGPTCSRVSRTLPPCTNIAVLWL